MTPAGARQRAIAPPFGHPRPTNQQAGPIPAAANPPVHSSERTIAASIGESATIRGRADRPAHHRRPATANPTTVPNSRNRAAPVSHHNATPPASPISTLTSPNPADSSPVSTRSPGRSTRVGRSHRTRSSATRSQ